MVFRMETKYFLGKYIQSRRKELKLTQKDMADRLLVTPQAISKWETGETLPDTSILLGLADILETTVDRILSGGNVIAKRHKTINIANVIEGFQTLKNLKVLFGEKSTFYQGAIEGINNKMNIDFEAYLHDDSSKEVLLAEAIIQYLMDGYTTSKTEIDVYIKSEKMRNVIYRYIGDENSLKLLKYNDNPELFDQIRKLEPEFSNIDVLNELPGEYLRLDKNKNYWATEIETNADFCYGIAVDGQMIRVFSYGYGGSNIKKVHEVMIQSR